MNRNTASKSQTRKSAGVRKTEELGMLGVPAAPSNLIQPINLCTVLEKGFFGREEKSC